LETWLDADLLVRFEGGILLINEDIALRWGSLAATAKRQDQPVRTVDGLLAATALHRDLTIVSRNVGDSRAFMWQCLTRGSRADAVDVSVNGSSRVRGILVNWLVS
jgi:predicted nucleic acid-binding protein